MAGATFSHRHNLDGTHDSICRRCFATVATEHDQDDLLAQEAEHICREEDLQRIEQPGKWLETNFGIRPPLSLRPAESRTGIASHSDANSTATSPSHKPEKL